MKQESVAKVLQQAILSGTFKEGLEMTQNELADSLGVSRMPVREALILLEYQGLIKRLPNNHVRVAPVTKEIFLQNITLLETLELQALAQCKAALALADTKRKLVQETVEEAELALHKTLAGALENPFLQKTLSTIVEVYLAHLLQQSKHQGDVTKALLEQALAQAKADESLAAGQTLQAYFHILKEEVNASC